MTLVKARSDKLCTATTLFKHGDSFPLSERAISDDVCKTLQVKEIKFESNQDIQDLCNNTFGMNSHDKLSDTLRMLDSVQHIIILCIKLCPPQGGGLEQCGRVRGDIGSELSWPIIPVNNSPSASLKEGDPSCRMGRGIV